MRISWISTAIVNLILMAAGFIKLIRSAEPTEALSRSDDLKPLLPPWLNKPIGLIELLVGSAALFRRRNRLPRLLSFGFLVGSTLLHAKVLVKGQDYYCNCFGSQNRNRISLKDLASKFSLAVLAGVSLLTMEGPNGTAHIDQKYWIVPTGRRNWFMLILISLTLVGAAFVFLLRSGLQQPPKRKNSVPLINVGQNLQPLFPLVHQSSLQELSDTLPTEYEPNKYRFLFGSLGCPSCTKLRRQIERDPIWRQRIRVVWMHDANYVPDVDSLDQEVLAIARDDFFDAADNAAFKLGVYAAPTLVNIDASGIVVSPPVVGKDQVEKGLFQS